MSDLDDLPLVCTHCGEPVRVPLLPLLNRGELACGCTFMARKEPWPATWRATIQEVLMLCLWCTTAMREVLHTRGAEDGWGSPAVLYQCPSCETLCHDHLRYPRGQVWVFVSGASFTLTQDALADRDFCARFRLEPVIGGAATEAAP
jgi:hypothetical protein